jgi:hypothetical protein
MWRAAVFYALLPSTNSVAFAPSRLKTSNATVAPALVAGIDRGMRCPPAATAVQLVAPNSATWNLEQACRWLTRLAG